jgi:hypothetical protein
MTCITVHMLTHYNKSHSKCGLSKSHSECGLSKSHFECGLSKSHFECGLSKLHFHVNFEAHFKWHKQLRWQLIYVDNNVVNYSKIKNFKEKMVMMVTKSLSAMSKVNVICILFLCSIVGSKSVAMFCSFRLFAVWHFMK